MIRCLAISADSSVLLVSVPSCFSSSVAGETDEEMDGRRVEGLASSSFLSIIVPTSMVGRHGSIRAEPPYPDKATYVQPGGARYPEGIVRDRHSFMSRRPRSSRHAASHLSFGQMGKIFVGCRPTRFGRHAGFAAAHSRLRVTLQGTPFAPAVSALVWRLHRAETTRDDEGDKAVVDHRSAYPLKNPPFDRSVHIVRGGPEYG